MPSEPRAVPVCTRRGWDRDLLFALQFGGGLLNVARNKLLEAPVRVLLFDLRRDQIRQFLPGFPLFLRLGNIIAQGNQIVVEVEHIFGRGEVSVSGDESCRGMSGLELL